MLNFRQDLNRKRSNLNHSDITLEPQTFMPNIEKQVPMFFIVPSQCIEFRLGESLAKLFGLVVPGRLHGIRATDVARCATLAVQERPAGVHVVESSGIRRWASGDTTRRTT